MKAVKFLSALSFFAAIWLTILRPEARTTYVFAFIGMFVLIFFVSWAIAFSEDVAKIKATAQAYFDGKARQSSQRESGNESAREVARQVINDVFRDVFRNKEQ